MRKKRGFAVGNAYGCKHLSNKTILRYKEANHTADDYRRDKVRQVAASLNHRFIFFGTDLIQQKGQNDGRGKADQNRGYADEQCIADQPSKIIRTKEGNKVIKP